MFVQINDYEMLRYIETPRPVSSPTKIDVILQQRIKAFMKARRNKQLIVINVKQK